MKYNRPLTTQERESFDSRLTTPPWDCEEDGHKWVTLGVDGEGTCYYRCAVCGEEGES